MDLVVLEKIEFSILNGLRYIVRLEKKNGNKIAWKAILCQDHIVETLVLRMEGLPFLGEKSLMWRIGASTISSREWE